MIPFVLMGVPLSGGVGGLAPHVGPSPTVAVLLSVHDPLPHKLIYTESRMCAWPRYVGSRSYSHAGSG